MEKRRNRLYQITDTSTGKVVCVGGALDVRTALHCSQNAVEWMYRSTQDVGVGMGLHNELSKYSMEVLNNKPEFIYNGEVCIDTFSFCARFFMNNREVGKCRTKGMPHYSFAGGNLFIYPIERCHRWFAGEDDL